jgi:hypothetical protein
MNTNNEVKQERIKPMTLALFEGSLGAVFGLALAAVVFFQATAFGTVITDSFLSGLVFGLSSSAVVLVAVPVIYFAIGWVLGYVHAHVYNGLKRLSASPAIRSEQDADLASGYQSAGYDGYADASPQLGRHEPAFGEQIPRRQSSHKRP